MAEDKQMNIYQKLGIIQKSLKVAKTKYNEYGNYMYRTAEGILEGLKPLLSATQTVILLNDEIVQVNDRIYIRSTATLQSIDSNESIKVTAYAREEATKKGMDSSQVTGASSSYARKYALNGMFAIDDTLDADGEEQKSKEPEQHASDNQRIDAARVNLLMKEIAGKKKVTLQKILESYHVKELKELTYKQYDNLKIRLDKTP